MVLTHVSQKSDGGIEKANLRYLIWLSNKQHSSNELAVSIEWHMTWLMSGLWQNQVFH